VIGSQPYEIYPDYYASNDIIYGKSVSNSFVIFWRMQFGKIYKFITTGNCFNDSINDYRFYSSKYSFYYCKNNNDVKKYLYEFLPKLHFYPNKSNYTFEIGNDKFLKS
jgi:hypothetical protein